MIKTVVISGETPMERYKRFREQIEPELAATRSKTKFWSEAPLTEQGRREPVKKVRCFKHRRKEVVP